MNAPVLLDSKNGQDYVYLEQLKAETKVDDFFCSVDEYTEYLLHDAWRSQTDNIALTWLLRDKTDNGIIAYMSIINDSVRLSVSEKELHNLNYPFRTIPAMKIAKLAVCEHSRQKYAGVGSFMIEIAKGLAIDCNADYSACRFLTVDADIEHNEGVLAFYEKNGFILNTEHYNKNRKTVSMRKDIFS